MTPAQLSTDSRGTTSPARRDLVRAVVVLLLAVVQILAGPITSLATGSGVGGVSDDYSSPVTPAGYAFAIWGLIYLGALAHGAYQVLPSQRRRGVHRRTGWWLVAAFACSTIWIPIFTAEVVWLCQIVILALVGCLLVAAQRATRSGPAAGPSEQALLRLPITLYLGWTVLAATAGFVVVVGRGSALAGFAFTTCWALVAIVLAATLVLRTGRSRGKAVILLG